jgi:hypothetical protein
VQATHSFFFIRFSCVRVCHLTVSKLHFVSQIRKTMPRGKDLSSDMRVMVVKLYSQSNQNWPNHWKTTQHYPEDC